MVIIMSIFKLTNNSNSLWKNMSCMLASELSIRITRLATAVILARLLSAHEFGVIAIAMTVQEIVHTLTRNGIGAKIVQTSKKKLHAVCNTVYRLNWQLSLVLFVIQCSLAQPLALFYKDDAIFLLVIILALPYLIYPWSLVQVYLIQRNNQLKITAFANGSQVSLDNLLCAGFALLGFGVWSVIIPKVIVAPCWVIYYRAMKKWSPDKQSYPNEKKQIIAFSSHVLGSEICATARRHIDRLLIAYYFGLDILGIYYFAINAGLGLTLSLSTAFNTAFYPHLCALKENPYAFKKAFKKGLLSILILSLLVFSSQAFLAQWYVAIIFGDKWLHAIPLLIILTLSGILRPAAESCAQLLRAMNKPHIDFKWNVFFTVFLSLAIYAAVFSQNIETVAYSILLVHSSLIPIYLISCWRLLHQTHEITVSSSNTNKPTSRIKTQASSGIPNSYLYNHLNTPVQTINSPSHSQLLDQAYPYLKTFVYETTDPQLQKLIMQIERIQSQPKLSQQEA